MIARRLAAVGLLALATLAACDQPVQLPADEAEAFAKEVDPIVENCLQGFNEKDLAKHSRDFDKAMLDVIDTASFPQAYDDIIGVAGKYQSRTMAGVFDQGDYRVVVYEAQFEHDVVTVRVVFNRNDPDHKITGLWFDSERLRSAKGQK